MGKFVGSEVGLLVGSIGLRVGPLEGLEDGLDVGLFGLPVGVFEGLADGLLVGLRVPAVGTLLGESVGDFEGLEVGLFVGSSGLPVGCFEGLAVGLAVAGLVGTGVVIHISGLHIGPQGPSGAPNSFETKVHASDSDNDPPSKVCNQMMRSPQV